jgi:hypothetical protein
LTLIVLTDADQAYAAQVAAERNGNAELRGYRPSGLQPRNRTGPDHLIGACGELAVCRWLGVRWDTDLTRFRLADVRDDIEVRTGRHPWGGLPVRLDDSPEKNYLLAIAKPPGVSLVGWLPGKVAKQRRYIHKWPRGNTTYLIPQRELWPLHKLPGGS